MRSGSEECLTVKIVTEATCMGLVTDAVVGDVSDERTLSSEWEN